MSTKKDIAGKPYYVLFGANGGTRTRDLLITNQLLYQLSHISDLNIIPQYFLFCNTFYENLFIFLVRTVGDARPHG